MIVAKIGDKTIRINLFTEDTLIVQQILSLLQFNVSEVEAREEKTYILFLWDITDSI